MRKAALWGALMSLVPSIALAGDGPIGWLQSILLVVVNNWTLTTWIIIAIMVFLFAVAAYSFIAKDQFLKGLSALFIGIVVVVLLYIAFTNTNDKVKRWAESITEIGNSVIEVQ